jgi:hypothetical protein
MMRLILIALSLLTAGAADVPENLKPPAGEVVRLKAQGKGKQIYVCKDSQWVLDRPDAELYDESGKQIGKHYKGPTWEAMDGSKVTGQVQQRANAPTAGAVPWLLLKAASGTGQFSRVTYIQRLDTEGGVAPPGNCKPNDETSVNYQATYYFYVKGE